MLGLPSGFSSLFHGSKSVTLMCHIISIWKEKRKCGSVRSLFCFHFNIFKGHFGSSSCPAASCEHYDQPSISSGNSGNSLQSLPRMILYLNSWRSITVLIFFFLNFFMCLGVCLHVCLFTTCMWYPQRQEEDVGSPGPGVADGSFVTVSAGNQTHISWKSSQCS